jgi:hypothetical protein
MSESGKSKGTVHVYYQFAPKGWQTSPGEITLEEVRKYLSDKPLRRGPERQRGKDGAENKGRMGSRPDDDQPHDSDAT